MAVLILVFKGISILFSIVVVSVGGGREDPEGGDHMYTYGWFTLMCGRNQHNIVKKLSSN